MFSLIKFLLKMVGTELIFKELVRLFHKEVDVAKQEVNKKLGKFIMKGVLVLLLVTLLMIGCVFVLLALGLYLNEAFYSAYKGFLMVGGGCISLVLLVILIFSMRNSNNN
ncbi:MAG: phage holin family protein [Candidatus Amoebophilus sp.]